MLQAGLRHDHDQRPPCTSAPAPCRCLRQTRGSWISRRARRPQPRQRRISQGALTCACEGSCTVLAGLIVPRPNCVSLKLHQGICTVLCVCYAMTFAGILGFTSAHPSSCACEGAVAMTNLAAVPCVLLPASHPSQPSQPVITHRGTAIDMQPLSAHTY